MSEAEAASVTILVWFKADRGDRTDIDRRLMRMQQEFMRTHPGCVADRARRIDDASVDTWLESYGPLPPDASTAVLDTIARLAHLHNLVVAAQGPRHAEIFEWVRREEQGCA